MCVAPKTLTSRAMPQHRRASSLDSSLASWRQQGEASTLNVSDIALDTTLSSTTNLGGRPHRSSTTTLFTPRRTSLVHDASMPEVPGQPSDFCKGSNLVTDEIVAAMATLSPTAKLQVLATARVLAAPPTTAPVAVSPPTVAVEEAVGVVAAPALPLQVEEEAVAEEQHAMVAEGPQRITVHQDIKTLRFGMKHVGPCEDDLDICKPEHRRQVFEISVGGQALWTTARSEMEVRGLRKALKGHEAPDFENGFSHTPIEAYTWTGKCHEEMTVPYLGYLINDRNLWKDYRARLYIATFFELPYALVQFPELRKVFYKMPSHEVEKLAFYESKRAKIRAEVRHQQAEREAAAAAAAAPRYEVKCSGHPFMTTEVATDMFGRKSYKDFTAYPFQLSYGGVKHDFVVRHSDMERLHQLAWQKRTGNKGYSLLLHCSFGRGVKAVVNRFDKILVANRYNDMYHTFQNVLKVQDWHTSEKIRGVMDLDGFDRKVQLSKTAAAGEGVDGVMGA